MHVTIFLYGGPAQVERIAFLSFLLAVGAGRSVCASAGAAAHARRLAQMTGGGMKNQQVCSNTKGNRCGIVDACAVV